MVSKKTHQDCHDICHQIWWFTKTVTKFGEKNHTLLITKHPCVPSSCFVSAFVVVFAFVFVFVFIIVFIFVTVFVFISHLSEHPRLAELLKAGRCVAQNSQGGRLRTHTMVSSDGVKVVSYIKTTWPQVHAIRSKRKRKSSPLLSNLTTMNDSDFEKMFCLISRRQYDEDRNILVDGLQWRLSTCLEPPVVQHLQPYLCSPVPS